MIDLPVIGTRTAVAAAGAAVALLAGTYGLGYWKGSSARAAAPQTTLTDRQADRIKHEQERARSVRDVTGNEDVLETRLTLPDIVLPDGTTKSQVRISRQLARQETEDVAKTKESDVREVEKIVEKKVVVPGPCPEANALVSPFASEPKLPRFLVGPTVGRNFSSDKTVFGGGAAVRIGPGWVRVAADTDPSASVGVEFGF